MKSKSTVHVGLRDTRGAEIGEEPKGCKRERLPGENKNRFWISPGNHIARLISLD